MLLAIYLLPVVLAALVLILSGLARRGPWDTFPAFRWYLVLVLVQLALWFATYAPGYLRVVHTAADSNGFPTIAWAMLWARRLSVAWPVAHALLGAESLWQTIEVSGPAEGRHPGMVWLACSMLGLVLAAFFVAMWPVPVSPLTRPAYFFRTAGHLWVTGAVVVNLVLLTLMHRKVWTDSFRTTHAKILAVYLTASVIGTFPPSVADWLTVTLAGELIRIACFAAWIILALRVADVQWPHAAAPPHREFRGGAPVR